MNTYIRDRLRADAAHVVNRAKAEAGIVHKGLRGRFRELLVDTLLAPWLPAPAACGTGMIVDSEDRVREATQEDIVVFDRSLVPSVLTHTTALEGVFPLDGVLARVEVKSKLTREEVRKSVIAAGEIYRMKFSGPAEMASSMPISSIFAFESDLTGDPTDELQRLLDVTNELGLHYAEPCRDVPGPIGGLCVVGRGAWGYGGTEAGEASWLEAIQRDPLDEILFFVGAISNSCFAVRADREGRGPHAIRLLVEDLLRQLNLAQPKASTIGSLRGRGAGGGIGHFILSFDTYRKCEVQLPSMK